jgi:hypothetical protein
MRVQTHTAAADRRPLYTLKNTSVLEHGDDLVMAITTHHHTTPLPALA